MVLRRSGVLATAALTACYLSHDPHGPPPEEVAGCPAEECNGLDDDCNGLADDGANVCPCPVEHSGGHPYMFCTAPLAWVDASALCAEHGYQLAKLEDPAENDWAFARASDHRTETRWWFGLNDRTQEGVFVWDGDGSTAAWTPWGDGEPNSFFGDEDCGDLMTWEEGRWNDDGCAQEQPFVCEGR